MPADFDVDAFLARPLECQLATAGPTVRPVWFLWEDRCVWVLSGPWSTLPEALHRDPSVALVIDTCDLASGEVRQVQATGRAEVVAFDAVRGHRLLSRYLGADETRWDPRFRRYLRDEPSAVWIRITPGRLTAHDLSF